jgi:hypothetical protein
MLFPNFYVASVSLKIVAPLQGSRMSLSHLGGLSRNCKQFHLRFTSGTAARPPAPDSSPVSASPYGMVFQGPPKLEKITETFFRNPRLTTHEQSASACDSRRVRGIELGKSIRSIAG